MENGKIKWGILGTGRIARKFAEALKSVDNSELLAVGSRLFEKAKAFANEFRVYKSYGSYEEVCRDKDIDIIYIATPHHLHCANTIMALERGKHVLCEKPFGVNGREVRQMLEKARVKNRFIMEAMWSRFLPNIIKVKEIIKSGELGKVKLVTSYFSFKSFNPPEHRHFNKELCGGSLLDIGIYPVFLSLYILGKPEKIAAMAQMSPNGIDYSCSMTFKYPDESLAVMHSSFLANEGIVSEIHCEKGKIVIPDRWFTPVSIKTVTFNGAEKDYNFEFRGNGYNYEADEAVKCVQSGKIESDIMNWNFSLDLIDTLDRIRKECGIIYPNHDFI
jgi:predicted dehydrogenase